MNRLGRAVLNSPARASAQRRYVVPAMRRIGGLLEPGSRVLEIGCGRGAGSALIVDVLGAASVDAVDIDPVMVRIASRRAAGRRDLPPVEVAIGDMARLVTGPASYDAVVDMGAIHLEPRWRDVLAEVHRVLRPGGRLYFEEIVHPRRQALSWLATGRPVPRDFDLAAVEGELDALGFVLVGLERAGWRARSGLVGDVVGVAEARPR